MTNTNTNMIIITTMEGAEGAGVFSQIPGLQQSIKGAKVTLIGGGAGSFFLNNSRVTGGGGAGGAVITVMDLEPEMGFIVGKGGDHNKPGNTTTLAYNLGNVPFSKASGGALGGADAGGIGGEGFSSIKNSVIIRGGAGGNAFNSSDNTSISGTGGNSILGGGGLGLGTNCQKDDRHDGFKNSGAGASGYGSALSKGGDGVIIIEFAS